MVSSRFVATAFAFFLPVLAPITQLQAEDFTVDVSFDRWVYPFNTSPGDRASASTFAAFGDPMFDNRDAQIVFGFDLSSVVPTDPSAVLSSVTLRATASSNSTFEYDPTYDSVATYGAGGTDTDAGRPLSLFGVGLRNGFTGLTLDRASTVPGLYNETTAFSPPGPPSANVRSVFAADEFGNDVSNNVLANTEVDPWAIGTTSAVSVGSIVPLDTEFGFSLDLSRPGILDYVNNGLNNNQLFFAITSLHQATQQSSAGIPSFYVGNASGNSLGDRAQLTLEFTAIPEPGIASASLLLLHGLAMLRRRRS